MQWQATDQFGNLYLASSDAQSVDELEPHLESLVDELRARVGDSFTIAVDPAYCEISGPDPGRVSHVLKSDWIGSASEKDLEAVQAAIERICMVKGIHLNVPK